MSLRSRAFSAVRWTAVGTIARILVQISQFAVLARILSPDDFGLMAIVIAIFSIAVFLSDLGVNSAFLQRRDITDQQRTGLFWFNIGTSCALTLIVIGISPLLSILFKKDGLTPLIMLISTVFIIRALGSQLRIAAEKALHFRGVMLVELTSTTLAFAAATWAALSGWGAYSLVLSTILNAFFCTLFFWIFLANGWRPLMGLYFSEVRSFLGFGGALAASNLINQINVVIDLFFGARMLLASHLGLYSVPRDLIIRFQFAVNPIITRITFPVISEVQNDKDRIRKIYLRTLNLIMSATAPVYVGLAFFSYEFIEILLGDGWETSAKLLRILAIWGAFRSIINPAGSLVLGMGRADLFLKWNIGVVIVTCPTIYYGALYGTTGLALAMLTLSVGLFVPVWLILIKSVCAISLIEYSLAVLRPLLLSSLSIGSAFLVTVHLDYPIYKLLAGLIISIPLYIGLSYLFNRNWITATLELINVRKLNPGK